MFISLLAIGVVSASEDVNFNKNKTSELSIASEISHLDNNKNMVPSLDSSTSQNISNFNNSQILSSNSKGDINGAGEPEDSFTALQKLITDDTTGILNLDKNYTFYSAYDSSFTNGIVINKPININGNGFTIDAKNQVRIFQISGTSVKLNDLILANANVGSSVDGGAIYWTGDKGELDNCSILNSIAKYGAAIYISVSNPTGMKISKSRFINDDGASYGAISIHSAKVNISDSVFEDCDSRFGGAIYITAANTIVSRCNFTENTVTERGGAIRVNNYYTVIDACRFVNNRETSYTDSGYGGGAILFDGSGIISNCEFINNYAIAYGGALYVGGANTIVVNSTFVNNSVPSDSKYGGAIYWAGDKGQLINSTIDRNSARYGAVYISVSSPTSMTISKSTFSNGKISYGAGLYITSDKVNIYDSYFTNLTSDYGGAIYTSGSITLNVNRCVFIGNAAKDRGGAIRTSSGTITISGSQFINNKQYSTSSNDYGGGALYLATTSTITNCTFINNTAVSKGGAIVTTVATTIKGSLFIYNYAGISAGAWHATVEGNSMAQCIVLHNNAGTSSVSTKVFDYSASGSNNVFNLNYNWFGNTLNNKTTKPNFITSRVTLTYWYFMNITSNPSHLRVGDISNITVRLNQYTSSSGSVSSGSFANTYTMPLTFNITSTLGDALSDSVDLDNRKLGYVLYNATEIGKGTVSANYLGIVGTYNWMYNVPEDSFTYLNLTIANLNGTVLNLTHDYHYYPEYDFPLLTTGILIKRDNITINGNGYTLDATNKLRIFNITGKNVTLNDLIFVKGDVGSSLDGGAIYWTGDKGKLNNATFIGNSAKYGAAVYIKVANPAGMQITNSKFFNNTGYKTGSSYAALTIYSANVNVSDSVFDGCSGNFGGAIYISGVNTTILRSNFTNNWATDRGGAIRISSSNARIEDCRFINNRETNVNSDDYGGGAIYVGSSAKFTGCTFINNSAVAYGGALLVSGKNVLIENSTFINNSVPSDSKYGGGIYWTGDLGQVNNSRFISNVAYYGTSIYTKVTDGTKMSISNSSFINGSSNEGSGVYVNSNNVAISNSIFEGLNASYGGAVYVNGDNTKIVNCNFTNNIAKDRGGAIRSNRNNLLIDGCSFIGNKHTTTTGDTYGGAAIYFSSASSTIKNSIFINNSAKYRGGSIFLEVSGTINNCTFIGSSAQGNAGTLVIYNGGNVYNCNFINSTAKGSGGAIYSRGTTSYIRNSTFINCYSEGNGGAIYSEFAAQVYTSLFLNGYAKSNGGAMYTTVANNYINDCVILNNTAATTTNNNKIIATSYNGNYAYYLDNNWWGNGLDKMASRPLVPTSYVSLTYWYFLNMLPNPSHLTVGDVSEITIRLNQRSTSSGAISSRTFGYNFPISLDLSSVLGDVSLNNVTLNKDKYAYVNFTATQIGIGNVTAQCSDSKSVLKMYMVPEDSFTYLNLTIARLNGTVLNLTHDYHYYPEYDFPLLTTGILIKRDNITINGNGHSLNATDKLRIFMVTGKNVTLNDMEFIKGKTASTTIQHGGAIYWMGIKGTINNCSFINCSATDFYGGAIFWNQTDGLINNSRFIGASVSKASSSAGGALYIGSQGIRMKVYDSYFAECSSSGSGSDGGAIYWVGTNGTMINSTFFHNYAQDDGIAVYWRSNNGFVSNCKFINNSGRYYGALTWSGTNGKLYNSSFINNYIDLYGAAICWFGASGLADNCTFVNNRVGTYHGGAVYWGAADGIINNSKFINNEALKYGGAIYATSTNLRIYNSLFEKNKASTTEWGGGAIFSSSSGTVYDCVFDSNSAYHGGAILSNASTWNIYRSNFTKNNASNTGGAFYSRTATTVQNSIFISNNAKAQDGGAIYSASAGSSILNSIFEKNRAGDDGGAIYLPYATVKHSTFKENWGSAWGGAIRFYSAGGVVMNSSFIKNTGGTGGVFFTAGNTEIYSSLFMDNYARSTAGILYTAGTGNNIYDCVILNNTAVSSTTSTQRVFHTSITSGTAYTLNNNWWGNTLNNKASRPDLPTSYVALTYWYFLNMIPNPSHLRVGDMSEITIRLNQRSTSGGAVSNRVFNYYFPITFNLSSSLGNLSLSNVTLNNDKYAYVNYTATQVGFGSVYSSYHGVTGTLRMYNVPEDSFTYLNLTIANLNGTVLNLTHDYHYYPDYDFPLLTTGILINRDNITINGNGHSLNATSKLRIFNIAGKNVTLNDLMFVKGQPGSTSTSTYGGAIYWNGINGTLNNCSFIDNTANLYGGAIYWNGANGLVNNSTFIRNTLPSVSNSQGGSIYVNSSATNMKVYNSIFRDGSTAGSSSDSGAIHWASADGALINSTFINNYAPDDGGAIYWTGARAFIFNSTFMSNRVGDDAILYLASTNGSAGNLKFLSNTPNYYGPFTCNAVNCVLYNSTFMNNVAGRYGGGLCWFGSKGLINNCTFKDNSATSNLGGAMYISSADCVVNNSKFYNNKVSSVNNGGAIYWNGANGLLNNSEFVGNSAQYGGAIYWSGTNARVYNTVFERNKATASNYGGGAIFSANSGTVVNSTFILNSAYSGGGVFANVTTWKFERTNFTNNNVTFSGGGIYAVSALTIKDSYFKQNTAKTNDGGAFYTPAAGSVITNSIFDGNRAGDDGGAFMAAYSTSTNLTLINNRANAWGGAIRYTSTGGSLTNVTFVNNSAPVGGALYLAGSTSVTSSVFINNYASSTGGAIHSAGTSNVVRDCIILNNTAATSTVASKVFSTGISSGTAFTLNYNWFGNTVYDKNTKLLSPSYSSLTYWLYLDSVARYNDLFINETTLVNFTLNHYASTSQTYNYNSANLPNVIFNITPYLGNSTKTAMLKKGIVSVNFTARELGYPSIDAKFNIKNKTHYFRVIPIDSFSALQKLITENTNGTLYLNSSYHYYPEWDSHLINGVKVNKTITINAFNTTVDGKNIARIFEVSAANVIINNITFVNGLTNGTQTQGGAILWDGNGGQLINSIFVNNTAIVHGGAIRWNGNNGKITNSVFENNTVSGGYGGAITWHGTGGVIESSNFTNNHAVYGGAICTDNAASSATIRNSIFNNNTAANNGGAIYNNIGGTKIIDSSFIDNEGKNGGAIYLAYAAELSGLVLINNTASDYGGAVYVNAASSVLSSSVIMKNKANFGGAIYVSNSGTNFVMKDSVLYQNIGYDGFIVSAPDGSGSLGTLNYNWWTNNETNLKIKPEVSSRFNLGNWLYLTVASNESVIEVNQSEKITVYLTRLANTGGDLGTTYTLPIVNFTVDAINGNISKNILKMNSGSDSLVYTAIKAGHNAITGKFYEYEFKFALPVFAIDSYTALQSIIDNNINGIINLTRNYRFYDDLDADYIGGVTINKTVTIIGNGFGINGLGKAALFKINGENITANNVTFSNGTVYWNGINGTVINSKFNSSSLIIGNNAKLNVTGNKEISAANDDDNVIVNYGELYLSGNKFTTAIYNRGTIVSPVVAIVLGNKTVQISPRVLDITAKVYDDSYNMIRDDGYKIYVDNLTYEPKFTINDYIASNYFVNFGNHTVTSNITGSTVYLNITFKNALIVGEPKKNITANITVNITDDGKVIIQANITPETLNGNITLYVGGDIYKLEFINGTGNTTLEKLPADDYNMVVYYPGDDLFNPYIDNIKFTIDLLPSEINITFFEYYVGEDVIVIINMTNGTTGLPTIYVDNKKITYTNLTNVTLGKLAYGNHTISVFYAGDKYYDSSVNITNFMVYKHNSTINITANDNVYGENIIVNITVTNTTTGQVSVNINGTKYLLTLTNSSAVLILNTLKAGLYNVSVEYLGDDKFYNSTANTSFRVYKLNTTLEVNTTNIDKGEYEVITITVPNNATGFVIVDVNGTVYSVGIVNGTAKLYIANLTEGNYSVLVNYTGDNKYLPNFTTANFTVSIPILDLGVKVDNINVGQNATVNITVPDGIKGIISVYVDSKFYQNVTAVNGTAILNITGLKAGNHHVRAVLGDLSGETTFMVSKLNSTVIVSAEDIFVGNKTNITIKSVPNENVTVYIGTKKLTITLNETGDAIVNITGLLEGNYTVVVIFEENENYLASSNDTSFTVYKVNSTIGVNVSDITTKLSEIINITVTDGATGQVLIDINGTKYLLTLNNSKVNLTLSNLKAGKYNVNVTYLGDNKFNNSTFNTTFTVSKVNSTVIVVANDIVEGDVVLINVTVPNDATGIVVIKVNNTPYKVAIINGTAVLQLINLESGNYSVVATYNGDDVYLTGINSTSFLVLNMTVANITVDDVNYTVMVPTTVNITTNFNGLVDVYIDGIKQDSVNVTNFTGTVNIKGLTAGNHTLMFVYAGNSSVTSITAIKNITVSKRNSTVVISVDDIESGSRIIANVNASGNGSATIILFNSTKVLGTFSLLINNGTGSIIVPYIFNLTGMYGVNVTYNGDNVYLPSYNSTTFEVTAAVDYDFKVITTDVLVGETVIVNVTLPGSANANVILTLPNGTNLTVKAVNGFATFNVTGLPYGNYTVNATYVGDNNYQRATKQGKFSILKHDPLLNLTCDIKDFNATGQIIGSTTLDGKVNLTVTLPNDATGNVTIYLNNQLVGDNLVIDNGKLVIELKDYFEIGVNTVNVTYTGDNKYYNSTVVNFIFASARTTQLNVTVENDTYVVGSDVVLNISSNAKGNISIYLNSELIETVLIDGNLSYTINNVTAGHNLVMVVFHPNDNFTGMFNTTNFTVIKKNTTIGIEVIGNSASLPVTVVVTVDNNVTGWVNAYINSTTPQNARGYIVNNQVTFVFYGIEVGKHNVTIVYEGDDNFNVGNNSKIFAIDKALYYPVNVTVEDIYVGENAYVIVKLPVGATGLINITLKGKNYTGILDENATVNITIPTSDLLIAAKYNIVVQYNGSDNFNATSVLASFNVLKINDYVFNVNVTDIKFNDVEIINITLPSDINNTIIKVLINGVEYNVTVIDGNASLRLDNLTVGSKLVKVIFEGNNKYVPLNRTDKFVVSPDDLYLNIEVVTGITNATINIISNPKVNETVNVYVGGKNKTITLVNGIGNVTFTDLAAGNYTAIVIFDATENYTATSNKTSFTLNKQDFNITIVVENDVLYVGDNNTITITYTAVKSTDLIITVNGKVVPLAITNNGDNNTAVISLVDLTEGNYNISVKYIGDEYNLANASKSFNVYKYDVNASEKIIIWNNANVTVTMPNNASGIVTVTVNGKSYNKTINDGKVIIEVPGLSVGTHTLTVSYANDTYYGEFRVNKLVTVLPKDDYNITIIVPQDLEIDVSNNISVILPINATGKVAIYMDGKLLNNASLISGKAIVPILSNLLTVGNHTIRAIYYGDINYTSGENTTVFTLVKKDIGLNVTVGNVTVVDGAVITVMTNMSYADGALIINVAGINYTANIKNNTASITLNPLDYGTYNVTVYYAGNNRYNVANVTAEFNVVKLNTTIVANAVENVITVSLDNRTTGIVYVEFKGKNYTGIIYKGNATIILPVIDGKFDLTVMYDGDDKFNGNNTSVVVTIHNNSNYTINATIIDPEIAVANNIVVTLPANATGNVSVYLDGVLIKNASLSGGKLIVPVDANLMTAGHHTIRAVYSGDSNYTSGENTTVFTLVKKDIGLNVTVGNVTVVDGAVITVMTNMSYADGVLIINVVGVNYTANIKNNTASITLNPLDYGTYNVTVYYAGNNRYNVANITAEFNVVKLNTTIIANSVENVITVSLDNRTSGIVYVEFDGKNYTGIIYKGNATIVLPVVHGKFDLTLVYEGDEKFNANTTSVSVIIHNDSNYTINATIIDPQIGVANNIVVTLPANATGNVSVYLDGVLIKNASLSGGKLIVPVGANLMTAGNHTIRVVYSGDSNYTSGENTTEFTLTKRASNINATAINIKVGDVEIITVNAPKDISGVILLNINGNKYYVDINNGSGSINITKLTNGTYNVIASYEGNDLYNASNYTTQFNVTKISDYDIVVDYGKVVNNATKVNVTLPGDATGLVTIIINGTNFTGAVYKGKAVIEVTNIIDNHYEYLVLWDGDDKYTNGSKSGILYNDAFREDSQVIVSVDDIFVNGTAIIKVNVTSGATGNVRITLNGKNIIVPLVNSSVTYKTSGFSNGTYDVSVVYLGDRIYGISENSTKFTVSKYNSTISIATNGSVAGENTIITITSNNDASGDLEITINGTKYRVVMNEGKAILNTTFIKYGLYNITVDYGGNDKYYAGSNTSSFIINPVTPSVVISVNNIKVGENATIIVTVPNDSTGLVTISVGGKNYNATIYAGKVTFNVPDLGNGTYNVVANYMGDEKYEANNNVTSFNVTKVDIVPDVTSTFIVENQTNITVHVPKDVTGNITLFVGGNTIISPISGGIARFNLNNVGNGTNITFVYAGDDKYNEFNTSAILLDSGIKLSSSLSIMISNIFVGDDAIITVGVTERASGNITINIAGRSITKEIRNGSVTFTVSDLAYGTYNVTAVYSGDSKFLSSNITSSISVAKHISVVIVSAGDIKVGENATIIVTVSGGASGNVTIKINDVDQGYAVVSGRQAVFVIPNLGNGTYEVVATYNGDAKYLNSTGNATFKVSKVDINPDIDSTSVLDNKTNVTVVVPSDATGNITIIVGANQYTAPINEGKAFINLSDVCDGTNITVIYDGDNKYNGFNKTAVVTDKGIRINPSVIVVSDKDKYLAGETAVITITVPEDARGNVTIKVNGVIIAPAENINGSKVIYNYTVPSSGEFNVEVIYNGDLKYAKATNTTSFNASKVNSTVVIEVNSTTVGESVIIVVKVPIDATGKVILVVGSKSYIENISDGDAIFNISGLARDTYTVQASYDPVSDVKYLGNTNSTSFEITPKSASLDIIVNPITYGEDANVIVNVPGDAKGTVTITVGDTIYLANIDNGVAKFNISGLEPGVTKLEVNFAGDDQYGEVSNSTNVTVYPKSSTIDVIVEDINKGETAVINVIVPKDATGSVIVIVGGKNYSAIIDGGKAVINISGLDSGVYNVLAKYLGDKYYGNSTNDTVSFNVFTDSSIITNVITRAYGSDYDYEAVFTDKLGKPLVNANVIFAVNGKEYNVVTDENGVARLPGGTLGVGNHTIVAINPVTGYETHNVTEIKPRLINNEDIDMDFKDGSRYSVRVLGDDGKPVGAGVEIVIKVNTVNYKVKTNKNGYASLAINLNPGKYTISAAYKGFKVSNKLTVRQTLSAKKTQVAKKSAKVSKIKATLKWSSGKGINGKKVTMKFRGKVYSAKTNSNGIATFKLPKKAIQKLKAGKTYRVRFTYLTNSIYKYVKIKN